MSKFNDLVNIESFWEKKNNFDVDRWEVIYYCKDCEKKVNVKKQESKLSFECEICWWRNIIIWTEKWIEWIYKL